MKPFAGVVVSLIVAGAAGPILAAQSPAEPVLTEPSTVAGAITLPAGTRIELALTAPVWLARQAPTPNGARTPNQRTDEQ